METTVERACTVEQWDRPTQSRDDSRVHWVAVRVGQAAPSSQVGQLVNMDDLQNGAQQLPWSRQEWLSDAVNKAVAGLPLQIEHNHATAGGGINSTMVDERDGSLMMGGYVHTETENGRAMWDGIQRGELREASLQYDIERDDIGRLRACRIRELSLVNRGRIAGTTIRVYNSADHERPVEIITKASNPVDSNSRLAPRPTMSDNATPMQEDAAPAAAATTTNTPTSRPTIDTTDMEQAVEQWLALSPDQQAMVDAGTRSRVLFEITKYAKAGKEAQRERAAAEQAARERAEREGKERFDKLRSTFAAVGKERGIDLDNEEHANGVLALFNNPNNQFYGTLLGGMAEDTAAKDAELERLREEKETLMAALQAAGRHLPSSAPSKKTAPTPVARPSDSATPEAKRPATAPASDSSSSASSSSNVPLLQQGAAGDQAREQMARDAAAANLPIIRMGYNGTIENGGIGIFDPRDPFPIDPKGVAMLKPGLLPAITVKNSAGSGASVVPQSMVDFHARQEPEPAFNQSCQLTHGRGGFIPGGHIAQLPCMQAGINAMQGK